MKADFSRGRWLYPPKRFAVSTDRVEIATESRTDLWQRTYYGFRSANAPMLLLRAQENFSFTVKAEFDYENLFDQCGVVVYLGVANWFKVSVEYENPRYSRLGSVVTNSGYSDWATTDIRTPSRIWYRLSRRGPDFLIESSFQGRRFQQMRIFHLHRLGETTKEAAVSQPPPPPKRPIRFGLYACSPVQGSFTARFSNFKLGPCLWHAHASP